MPKSIIVEGKTTNEAIEKGLKELNISKNMVDVTVIEEPKKRSFYSILAPRIVKIEMTVKEDNKSKEYENHFIQKNENMEEINLAKEAIDKFLTDFLNGENTFNSKIEDYNIVINIEGENVNKLIGYRGETINAIQVILMAIANKHCKDRVKIFLDVAGYKEKRVKTLEELAEKISKTVMRTGKSVTLEPMSAYERKIIHTALQKNNKIKTYSKGEEPYRRIVISLN